MPTNTETTSTTGTTKAKKRKTKLQLKSPTQERSRQTVSTILEACARIITREGFFGVTTDKVAKEAGVSIGSLYQFFGNKESVVSALIHDMLKKDQEYIFEKAKSIEGLPTNERIRKLAQFGIEVYRQNAELRAQLQNVQLYLTDREIFNNTMKKYMELILKSMPEVPGRNPQIVSYIILNAYSGLLDRALADYTDVGKDQAFVDEVLRLIDSYLTK